MSTIGEINSSLRRSIKHLDYNWKTCLYISSVFEDKNLAAWDSDCVGNGVCVCVFERERELTLKMIEMAAAVNGEWMGEYTVFINLQISPWSSWYSKIRINICGELWTRALSFGNCIYLYEYWYYNRNKLCSNWVIL